ncbi:MAG: hypothetical protein AAF682_07965 [Planctomycetota bacterium]
MLANIGIPLIHLHVGFALVSLPAVALVEALLYRRVLSATFARALLASTLANLLTTAVGVPIAWALSAMGFGAAGYGMDSDSPVLLGIRYAPWLPPMEGLDVPFYRIYPAAVLTLLLPCMLLSILMERPVVRARLGVEGGGVGRAVVHAHFASYGLLFAFCFGWLAYAETATVGLPPERLEDLRAYVSDEAWGACVPHAEGPPTVDLGNAAWFGPPVYRLGVRGVHDVGEQECLARAVREWLEERNVGPLVLEFCTEGEWVQVDELTRRFDVDVLTSERLDGRH